jgi:hypothetical protein
MTTNETTRYEVRNWAIGGREDQVYQVRVQVTPGKFEGEPVWTERFYAASNWADEAVYDSDGSLVCDCFRAPFGLDAFGKDELSGNPPELTEQELDCLGKYAGALVFEDSVGFVSVDLYETTNDYEAAIDRLRAEYETDGEEDES